MTITAKTFGQRLCPDIVHSVAERNGRDFLVTNFRYPDGDLVSLYFYEESGISFVSDNGNTLFKCTVDRISLTEERKAFVASICHRSSAEFFFGEIRKPITDATFRKDCFAFCETVTRISNLHLEPSSYQLTDAVDEVAELLQKNVPRNRTIARNWFDPDVDPDGDFPVDFHLNGVGEPRNIFFVGSSAKGTLTVAVAGYLKLNNAFAPTLSVIDPKIRLPKHNLNRIQRVSTEIRFGVKGYENDIIKFAMAGV